MTTTLPTEDLKDIGYRSLWSLEFESTNEAAVTGTKAQTGSVTWGRKPSPPVQGEIRTDVELVR